VARKGSVAGSLGAVSRRVVLALGVILVVVAGGVFLLVRPRGDKERAAVADPLAEALGYAPASAELVAAMQVQAHSPQGDALRQLAQTFPAARFGADAVRGAVRSLGFDADQDLPSLLGGPIVLAGPAKAVTQVAGSAAGLQLDLAPVLRAGAIAAVVGRSADDVATVLRNAVDDRRLVKLADLKPGVAQYRLPNNSGVLGVRGGDLVLAGDTPRLRQAVDLRDRQGGLTRATFEQRLGGVPQPALVLATAQPRALIGDAAKGVSWVDALRGGAVSIRLAAPGVRVAVHLTTDPKTLRPEDLPLAPKADPPQPAAGTAPAYAAVRNLSQTIHVLDAARGALELPFLKPVTDALSTLDSVKGPLKTFGRIDVDSALVDQLTGTTTVTQEPNGEAVRTELTDGDPLRTALNRIATVPDFLVDAANITDLDLDKAGDDAYEVRRSGTTFLKLAVLANTLVVTNDLTADLGRIAQRPPRRATQPTPGALTFHVEGSTIQDQLVTRLGLPGLARLVLGDFGDLDGSATAALGGVDLDAALTLQR
jgi:hypothetical protein